MKVQHVCLVEACTVCHQFQAFEIPSGMSGQPGRIQSLKGKKIVSKMKQIVMRTEKAYLKKATSATNL